MERTLYMFLTHSAICLYTEFVNSYFIRLDLNLYRILFHITFVNINWYDVAFHIVCSSSWLVCSLVWCMAQKEIKMYDLLVWSFMWKFMSSLIRNDSLLVSCDSIIVSSNENLVYYFSTVKALGSSHHRQHFSLSWT